MEFAFAKQACTLVPNATLNGAQCNAIATANATRPLLGLVCASLDGLVSRASAHSVQADATIAEHAQTMGFVFVMMDTLVLLVRHNCVQMTAQAEESVLMALATVPRGSRVLIAQSENAPMTALNMDAASMAHADASQDSEESTAPFLIAQMPARIMDSAKELRASAILDTAEATALDEFAPTTVR